MRVNQDRADEWVAGIVRLWLDPEVGPQMASAYQKILTVQDLLRSSLGIADWSQVNSWDLVAIVEAHATLLISMEAFLPSGFAHLPPVARRFLWTNAMIITGLEEAEAGGQPRPLLLAHLTTFAYLAGPRAETEITRRGLKNVGFYEAMVVLLTRALAARPNDSVLDNDLEQVLVKVRKAVWKKIPKWAKAEIADVEASGKTSPYDALKAAIDRQAVETGLKDWAEEPLEVLARSLDGELNIAPQAIGNDLTDLARSLNRKRKLETPAEEGILVRLVEEGDTPEIPSSLPDAEGLLRRLDAESLVPRFLEAHPEHREGIAILLSGEPLTTLAERQGVTVQTAINRKKRALKALAAWGRTILAAGNPARK